ncbi:DUF4301 family protein [Geothermobacter hydrogeniphilus]|uniref:DUF4301 domain-containing protein n=1 Tax=Geothermobacter hydrogeniphilus TaxID=1969733 RepID=A0A1X0Y8N4_9BACT|nr:DUF4301 family protein [Geothermobacter hydrogeniphilus]ORJ61561.1 hypothetical protein B5V00_05850 [Geothermobacter hydrogeniphilus]
MPFTQSDLAQIAAHGLSITETERQLELFRNPPEPLSIDRACTPGDGISLFDADREGPLVQAFEESANKGRFSRFVPASGAASRMFKNLFHSAAALDQWLNDGDCPDFPFHQQFFSQFSRFPFYQALKDCLRSRRQQDLDLLLQQRNLAPALAGLLEPWGLDYARRPKGLLPFHAYPDRVRTPLEEHLSEALKLAGAEGTPVRLHFTVSPEFLEDFQQAARLASGQIPAVNSRPIAISFSCQHTSTDTIAVDLDNRVLRNERGELIFRPAGHGALLDNLEKSGGDLVLVKNIDNVVPEPQQPEVIHWWKLLGGKLVEIQSRVHAILRRLESSANNENCRAAETLLETLGLPASSHGDKVPRSRRDQLLQQLNRPIRVCGMVRNSGEPGGGPFWVAGRNGTTPQIVEMAQIPRDDKRAQQALAAATHFNPVLMACALRDHHNRPYRLSDFVDEQAIIITRKSEQGLELKALERPGLWNGAMAGWLTLFVEVPEQVFQPVKTVNDLLRPGHQVTSN